MRPETGGNPGSFRTPTVREGLLGRTLGGLRTDRNSLLNKPGLRLWHQHPQAGWPVAGAGAGWPARWLGRGCFPFSVVTPYDRHFRQMLRHFATVTPSPRWTARRPPARILLRHITSEHVSSFIVPNSQAIGVIPVQMIGVGVVCGVRTVLPARLRVPVPHPQFRPVQQAGSPGEVFRLAE